MAKRTARKPAQTQVQTQAQTTEASKAPLSGLDALKAASAQRPARGTGIGKVSATEGPHKGASKLEVIGYLLTQQLVAQLIGAKQRTDDACNALLVKWFPDGTTFQKWAQYRAYFAQWGNPKSYKGIGPCKLTSNGKGKSKTYHVAKTSATELLDDYAKSVGYKDGIALCAAVFSHWSELSNLLIVASPDK